MKRFRVSFELCAPDTETARFAEYAAKTAEHDIDIEELPADPAACAESSQTGERP